MPATAGKQPVCRLVLESAPVLAQRIEQRPAEHDVAILAPLAALDMNDHALAVDIADLQTRSHPFLWSDVLGFISVMAEVRIQPPNMTWGSLRRTSSLKPRLVVSESIR
jgi:hypothetical protein